MIQVTIPASDVINASETTTTAGIVTVPAGASGSSSVVINGFLI